MNLSNVYKGGCICWATSHCSQSSINALTSTQSLASHETPQPVDMCNFAPPWCKRLLVVGLIMQRKSKQRWCQTSTFKARLRSCRPSQIASALNWLSSFLYHTRMPLNARTMLGGNRFWQARVIDPSECISRCRFKQRQKSLHPHPQCDAVLSKSHDVASSNISKSVDHLGNQKYTNLPQMRRIKTKRIVHLLAISDLCAAKPMISYLSRCSM